MTITNSLGMQLALIPPGEFLMGSSDSDEHGRRDEKPQQRVRLTQPFYLGVHEVSQEQYERVMKANPSAFQDPPRPVEELTWNEAFQFCEALSVLPEEKAAGRIYRLPTEAEWEYACRVGTNTPDFFGNDASQLGQYAWFRDNSGGWFREPSTHPIGRKKPNAWGLHDMCGNVWEWCADWYGDYGVEVVTDPSGPAQGSDRAVRGGGWDFPASRCRSANRERYLPPYSNNYLGFRVAATPSTSKASEQAAEPEAGPTEAGEADRPREVKSSNSPDGT